MKKKTKKRAASAQRSTTKKLRAELDALQDRLEMVLKENASLATHLLVAKEDSAVYGKWRQEMEERLSFEQGKRREYEELLRRARDLLIHEKIDAQISGRERSCVRDPLSMSVFPRPAGWRTNGIGSLIEQIEGAVR